MVAEVGYRAGAVRLARRPRSTDAVPKEGVYGNQGALTMKLTSSIQCTVASQGFLLSPSLAR